MQNYKNKLTDLIKRYGILGCLHKTICRIGRMIGIIYLEYLAYFKNLPETIDINLLPSYRKMTMSDFKKQANFNKEWFTNRKLKQIEGFIGKPGYSYYGIYNNDTLICYGAISMEYDNFTNKEIDQKAAYLFDDYTNADYRGRGLHQKIVEIREYEAWKQQKTVTFAYVASSNRASSKGYKRCGYTAKLKLVYKRIGKNKPFKKELIKI